MYDGGDCLESILSLPSLVGRESRSPAATRGMRGCHTAAVKASSFQARRISVEKNVSLGYPRFE